MKKIKIALILMITMLLTCVITTKTKQTKAAENPSLSIVSYNISYSEYIYLTVAVGTNNVDYNNNTVKLLFWNQTQSEYTINNADYISLTEGLATVKGQKCLVYYSNGIAAKKMADDIILRAYVNIDGTEYYSDVITYSVVQYVKDKIASGSYSPEQYNLWTAMINYGTCAQILFDYGTTNLANAKFASIKVEEGTCANGLTKDYLIKGQTVTITPNEDTNKEFAYWVDENDNIVSYDQEYTFTLNDDKTYKAVYRHIINLTLNTVTYEVASTDNMTWYTPTAKGTSDLLYINITITINDENYQNSLYTLIINGNKINSSKVNIANNVLTYQMEDPNWSDFI